MNNKIAIGVITKTTFSGSDAFLYKVLPPGDNITTTKNQLIRHFMHNTDANYVIIYNTISELRQHTASELEEIANNYVTAIDSTGINFFTGPLLQKTVIDYGDIKINVGDGVEQKIVLEALTRSAVNTARYFDVRLQDTLCSQDYAIRLGSTRYYPSRASKMQPWLFDILHKSSITAKQVLDDYDSSWYKYKHDTLPWEQFGCDIETLKPQLKEIKNGFKL